MKLKLYIIICSIVLAICNSFSCAHKNATKNELIAYLNDPDNGCVFTDSINEFKVEVKYKPIEMLIENEIKYKKLNKEQVELLKKNYENFINFSVSMSYKEGDFLNSAIDYTRINTILTNELGDFIELVNDKHEIVKISDSFFPKMYEMSKKTSVMVVFNKASIDDSDEFKFKIKKGLLPKEITFIIKKSNLDKVSNIL